MSARAALILCGGASRRMGQPKAMLPFGPESLLQRVTRLIGPAVDEVVVVAASGQDLPRLPASVRVVRDHAAAQGPLQGLATGLAALPDAVDLVYALATDVPFLVPEWWVRLADLGGSADLAIPEVEGRFHPLAAVYRRGPTLDAAEQLLRAGRLRLTGLVEVMHSRVIAAHDLVAVDPEFATLRNLNTPEDYQQALQDAGFTDRPL